VSDAAGPESSGWAATVVAVARNKAEVKTIVVMNMYLLSLVDYITA
jgi:hypothetical protein